MRKLFFLILFLLQTLSYAINESEHENMLERLQPVGNVYLAQNTEKTVVKKSKGQEIYEQHCIVCHNDGLAGAPKFRNAQDWKSRLAEKKLNELVASAVKGLNAMPAKGTCIECSEEDLKAALTYMLPNHD
ncbi:MAG: cytochrome c5 family protein [Legionella sp. 40-6]|nr:cytochrome c5 family protein [Legionella sp.]OJY38916.1 MAG: cytochrome c5 family protein [Legionella sp. 40-6]